MPTAQKGWAPAVWTHVVPAPPFGHGSLEPEQMSPAPLVQPPVASWHVPSTHASALVQTGSHRVKHAPSKQSWSGVHAGSQVKMQKPFWQLPPPHGMSFVLAGWVHWPFPLQTFLVHSLPSSGQATPTSLFWMTQRPLEQTAFLQRLRGWAQGLLALQEHFSLPRHFPVQHCPGRVQVDPA